MDETTPLLDTPIETAAEQNVSLWGKVRSFFEGFPVKRYAVIIGILVVAGGAAATVLILPHQQQTQSHASGTVTLQYNTASQIDLAKKTVSFLVQLVPSGDTPPSVAAVRLHIEEKESGLGEDALHLVSVTLEQPEVFSLESDNPSGIPPFSQANEVSVTPQVSPRPMSPVPAVSSTPAPCPTGVGGREIPCRVTPSAAEKHAPVLGASVAPQRGTSLTGETATQMPVGEDNRDQQSGHLYFSVGDQYTKTVNKPALLARVTFALPTALPENASQAQLSEIATRLKDATLTLSFGSDTKVYLLNPAGDSTKPFVETPFISQPLTVSVASLLNPSAKPTPVATPIVCQTNAQCPTNYACIKTFSTGPGFCQEEGKSSETPSANPTPVSISGIILQEMRACLDLQKPMSDSTSNYNSSACKAYANRASTDLNHDGYVNGTDLNLYYRAQAENATH